MIYYVHRIIYYCHSFNFRLKLSVYLTVELRNTEFKTYYNFTAADEVALIDKVSPNYGTTAGQLVPLAVSDVRHTNYISHNLYSLLAVFFYIRKASKYSLLNAKQCSGITLYISIGFI